MIDVLRVDPQLISSVMEVEFNLSSLNFRKKKERKNLGSLKPNAGVLIFGKYIMEMLRLRPEA
jgi:hypothetical protein